MKKLLWNVGTERGEKESLGFEECKEMGQYSNDTMTSTKPYKTFYWPILTFASLAWYLDHDWWLLHCDSSSHEFHRDHLQLLVSSLIDCILDTYLRIPGLTPTTAVLVLLPVVLPVVLPSPPRAPPRSHLPFPQCTLVAPALLSPRPPPLLLHCSLPVPTVWLVLVLVWLVSPVSLLSSCKWEEKGSFNSLSSVQQAWS